MPEISPFGFIAESYQVHGICRTKEILFLNVGVLGAANVSGVLHGTKSVFCFRSIFCRFERYAAHRKPPLFALCCKYQQQQKTFRAQQYTSRLVI